MRYLDVLCIDGIIGVGKSSQIIMFRNLLKLHGIPNKVISLKKVDNTQDTKDQLLSISEYLNSEPDGVVLCDGSVATDIVDDIARNMHYEDLWSKHKDNLQIYEDLNSRFNFVNIVLTPANLDMCDSRLQKKANMSGSKKEDLGNQEHLMVTAKGLKEFDNNMLTYNININNIDLDGYESITEIHNKVVEIVKNNFQIKSPQFEGF